VSEPDSSPSCSTDAGTSVSATHFASCSTDTGTSVSGTTHFAPPLQDVVPLRPPLKEPRLYVDKLLFEPDSMESPQEERSRYAVGGLSVSRQVTEDHG